MYLAGEQETIVTSCQSHLFSRSGERLRGDSRNSQACGESPIPGTSGMEGHKEGTLTEPFPGVTDQGRTAL